MSQFWCDYAWLGGDTATADVLIDVVDGRIAAVTAGTSQPPVATHLAGLTLPGLSNAHSHAFHRALRGRTQAVTGSFWTWRDQMYALAQSLTPDTYFDLAQAVFGEMLLAGVTCVGEFHYLHHGEGGARYTDPNAMGVAVVAAAKAAGIRITLLDTCYLHGGIGIAPNEVQMRFSDGSAEAWAERASSLAPDDGVRVGAAIHSVRAVDPASMSVVADWAAHRSTPLHAHVSEQHAENEQCRIAHGCTPTEVLSDAGAVNQRFTAVHATHLSDRDIALLGGSRSTICMCPTTERDLADGIGPTTRLRAAGTHISLGSDSHAVIDLFEEARAVELNERLSSNIRGSHTAATLLEAATLHGHRSLGWPDAGVIRTDAVADFVSVRLDSVRTAGAAAGSLLETAVFAASAADVHHVVVAGEVRVRDGAHVSFDIAAELSRTLRTVWEGA